MDLWPIDRVRAAIEQATGRHGRRQGDQWRLVCPSHPDREASLSLGENSEQHALLYCHAGCRTDDILGATGLQRRDLYPLRRDDRRQDPVVAIYRYTDEDGQLLYEVERTASKRFRQRRPDPAQPGSWIYNLRDTRRVLYRLPMVLEAIRDNRTIYLVEGEKDVHTVEKLGQVGTCNPGGAGPGKWLPDYTQTLRGAHVVLIADNDAAGQGLAHAKRVAADLAPVVASLAVGLPTVGKDTTDLITAGLGLDDITLVDLSVQPEPTHGQQPTLPDTRTHDSQADGSQTGPVVDPTGSQQPEGRKIRLTPASAFKIRPVRWVWEGRMPLGELCLIAGREGVGKSTFLAWLAAQVTNGNLPGIYQGAKRAVLYAAAEDAWDYTIAPRMRAAGADMDLVYRIDVVDEGLPTGLSLPRDSRELPDIAREHDAAVLMCDPILSLVDGVINPNHSKELRTALEPLKRAAEAAGLAVPALVHFNKSRDIDVLSMIAGSRAWAEVARAALAIARDDNAEEYTCIVSQAKNNLGRSDLPNLTYTIRDATLETEEGDAHIGRVVMLGETLTTAEEILQRRPARDTASGDVGERITQFLHQAVGAQNPRQIAEGIGANPNTVRVTLRRMLQVGQLVQPGPGIYANPPVVDRSAPRRPTQPELTCIVCGQPMINVDGSNRHPTCDPPEDR